MQNYEEVKSEKVKKLNPKKNIKSPSAYTHFVTLPLVLPKQSKIFRKFQKKIY